MEAMAARTDDQLLLATPKDPDAFAAFYRRHAHAIAGYFLRRTRSPEIAADLTAETFAAALQQCRRFDPDRGAAVAWLYGIARRNLIDAAERGHVEDRARRRMRVPRMDLDDEALERVEAVASSAHVAKHVADLLDALPEAQREAIEARVIHGRDYSEIATAAKASETAIRQRVSRGLARLRSGIKEEAL